MAQIRVVNGGTQEKTHRGPPERLLSAKALLDRNPAPTRAEIAAALDSNSCRCGTHHRILRAVALAATRMREYEANQCPGYDASMGEIMQPIPDADILDLGYFTVRQP